MKTLQKGRPQKGWSTKRTCTGRGNGGGGCGAKLLVEKADIYETSRGYYDGSTDYYRTFACPECGVETDFDSTYDVPFSVPSKTKWLKMREAAASEHVPEPTPGNGETDWL